MKSVGRLLNMGANPAAMNMAIDEAILLAQKEQPNPTLRFYEWSSPAFSFGYFQDIDSEVDVEACRADGIELVKRMTGGGTVVHGWELTYTLVLPRAAAEMRYFRGVSMHWTISRQGVSETRCPRAVLRCVPRFHPSRSKYLFDESCRA